MGSLNIIMLKKISLLSILLLSSSMFSTSFAGRALIYTIATEVKATHHEEISEDKMPHHAEHIIHERLLRMNTKDYGSYDPAPSMAKPPFKLIPN